MNYIKQIFLLVSLICFALPSFTQDASQVLAIRKLERSAVGMASSADLYNNLGYKAYAEKYAAMNADEVGDVSVLKNVANSYRMNADYENAEHWYAKFVNPNSESLDILYYAQTLQANGRCKDAVRWFGIYKDKMPNTNDSSFDFITNCDQVEDFRNHEMVTVSNETNLNTPHLDFCAAPVNDGLIFTSNRGESSNKKDKWTDENFTDLYYVNKNERGFGLPMLLMGEVNGKFHDGVNSVPTDDNIFYFSRNNKSGKRTNGVKALKIYEAKGSADLYWNESAELPFNSDEFASCHPTIAADGKTMYFSSNRPGGYGGMDIYSSTKMENTWSTPVNLGPSINSEGNEIFPFICADNVLIFSSNGHAGFGGLDLFAAKADGENWNQRENCGLPYNTIKDDFGFYMNANKKMGYLSSNRLGGMGKDDIYSWSAEEPVDFFKIRKINKTLCFVEKGTNKKVGNVDITLGKSTNRVFGMTFKSDSKGYFVQEMAMNSIYDFNISKMGYRDANITIDPSLISSTDTECQLVELSKKTPYKLRGTIGNMSSFNEVISKASVVLKSLCTGKTQKIKSDENGEYSFILDCACEYEVEASKAKMTKASKTVITKKDCLDSKDKVLNLSLSNIAPKVNNRLIDNTPVAEGMIIELKNIYYDYNKANIRSDATLDLENLVELMNSYPTMEVELGSHTDSRGTEMYNLELSARRAASARQYIISKGISATRLSSKGYGESKLINQCSDGTQCSEDEHKINRRTEVKVTKFDNPDVKILYRN